MTTLRLSLWIALAAFVGVGCPTEAGVVPATSAVSSSSSSSAGGASSTSSTGSAGGGGACAWADYALTAPVDIVSPSGPLDDYALYFVLDTATLIAEKKLRPDGADLRITDAAGAELPLWIEGELDAPDTRVWTRVPHLAAGNSKLLLRLGNANAKPSGARSRDIFLHGLLKNASFESRAAWVVTGPDLGGVGTYQLQAPTRWHSDGKFTGYLSFSSQNTPNGDNFCFEQQLMLPQGSNYEVGFDLEVEHSPTEPETAGFNVLVNGETVWHISSYKQDIKGTQHAKSDAFPGGPTTLQLCANITSLGHPLIVVDIDNVHLRRVAAVDPTATVQMSSAVASCP